MERDKYPVGKNWYDTNRNDNNLSVKLMSGSDKLDSPDWKENTELPVLKMGQLFFNKSISNKDLVSSMDQISGQVYSKFNLH